MSKHQDTQRRPLLDSSRTRNDIPLRRYSRAQIADFLQEDRLDEEAAKIARRFAKAPGLPAPPQPADPSLR